GERRNTAPTACVACDTFQGKAGTLGKPSEVYAFVVHACSLQIADNLGDHIQRGCKPGFILFRWCQERVRIPSMVGGLGCEERVAVDGKVVGQRNNLAGACPSSLQKDQSFAGCCGFRSTGY